MLLTWLVAGPAASARSQSLVGDCDRDGKVIVSELVLAVNIALGLKPMEECEAVDGDSSGSVEIGELVEAVSTSIQSTLRVDGLCLRPGPASTSAPGLVPCEQGMTVRAFRCESESRASCLTNPPTLTVLDFGSISTTGSFTLTVGRTDVSGELLVFEAEVATGTKYRALAFGPIANGSGAGAGGVTTLEVVISPISEAAVRLVDEAGLENFDDEGVAAVVAAVEQANQGTNFAGRGVEEAVQLALDIARNDPGVQQTIQARRTPSATQTPTATATSTATSTLTPTVTPTWTPGGPMIEVRVLARPVGAAVRNVPSAGQLFLPESSSRMVAVTLLVTPAGGSTPVAVTSSMPAVADVVGSVMIPAGAQAATLQIQSGTTGRAVIELRAGDSVRELDVFVGESPDQRPPVLAPVAGVAARSTTSLGQVFISEASLQTLILTLLGQNAPAEIIVTTMSSAPGIAAVIGNVTIPAGSRAATLQIQTGTPGKAVIRLRAGDVVRDIEIFVGEPAGDQRPPVLAPIVGVGVRTVPSIGRVFIAEDAAQTLTVTLLGQDAVMDTDVLATTSAPGTVDILNQPTIPAGSRAAAIDIQTGIPGTGVIRLRVGDTVRDVEVVVGAPGETEKPPVIAPIVGVEVQ